MLCSFLSCSAISVCGLMLVQFIEWYYTHGSNKQRYGGVPSPPEQPPGNRSKNLNGRLAESKKEEKQQYSIIIKKKKKQQQTEMQKLERYEVDPPVHLRGRRGAGQGARREPAAGYVYIYIYIYNTYIYIYIHIHMHIHICMCVSCGIP